MNGLEFCKEGNRYYFLNEGEVISQAEVICNQLEIAHKIGVINYLKNSGLKRKLILIDNVKTSEGHRNKGYATALLVMIKFTFKGHLVLPANLAEDRKFTVRIVDNFEGKPIKGRPMFIC